MDTERSLVLAFHHINHDEEFELDEDFQIVEDYGDYVVIQPMVKKRKQTGIRIGLSRHNKIKRLHRKIFCIENMGRCL